ncbi:Rha family transcriptional regulator [Pontibacterium sp.]|uniref:Rha family transcriptional regulator n=1 Tax=Pontibacterium sp. TaxID=2036026 RepID=UPI00356208D6
MTAQPINPIDVITIHDDRIVTTSLKVAEVFGKRHDDVLRKIRGLECSAEFNARNFTGVAYSDGKGEKRPAYEMTKNGFVILVMGFTGKKAMQFKEAYIEAFDWMADKLARRLPADPPISEQQAAYLRSLVSRIAMREPEEDRPRTFAAVYRQLHVAFEVSRYTDISAQCYQDAVELLEDLHQKATGPVLPVPPAVCPPLDAIQIDLPAPRTGMIEVRPESLLNPDGNVMGQLLRQLRSAATAGQPVALQTVEAPYLEWCAAVNLLRLQEQQLSTLRAIIKTDTVVNVTSL